MIGTNTNPNEANKPRQNPLNMRNPSIEGKKQGATSGNKSSGNKSTREAMDNEGPLPSGYKEGSSQKEKRQVSDQQLEKEILSKLRADSDLRSAFLEVESKGGEVTLSGYVEDLESKSKATNLAKQIPGVREVTNQIKIPYELEDQEQEGDKKKREENLKPKNTEGGAYHS